MIKKIKYAWWRFLDRVEEKFDEEDINLNNPFWCVSEETWSRIVMNVRTKGSNYYMAEIDLWLDTAISENMLEREFADEWTTMDIIDAHKIKSIIKMIEVGVHIPALNYLNDQLDTSPRDMAIRILLK
jgi:hypothetical protein